MSLRRTTQLGVAATSCCVGAILASGAALLLLPLLRSGGLLSPASAALASWAAEAAGLSVLALLPLSSALSAAASPPQKAPAAPSAGWAAARGLLPACLLYGLPALFAYTRVDNRAMLSDALSDGDTRRSEPLALAYACPCPCPCSVPLPVLFALAL